MESKGVLKMEAEAKSENVVANVNYKIPESWKQDKYSWIYLGVLVIVMIAGAITGRNLSLLYLIITYVTIRSEEKRAKKDGITWPSSWWALCPPVYLWQRLTVLKQPRIHFWLWIGVSIGLALVLACFSQE